MSVPLAVRPWLKPDAWQTLMLLTATAAASYLAYWWPRRGLGRPFPLVAGASLTLMAFILAMPSYWRCVGNQAPFWTGLHWTMSLFVGNVEDPFGSSVLCPGPMPLALQAARIAALSATFTGLIAALLTAFRGQWDSLRARLAPSLVLVIGLDDDALPLLERLVVQKPSGTSLVVLERDPTHPNVGAARALGALVVVGDPLNPEELASVLRAGKSLRTAYLLSTRSIVNVECAQLVMAVVGGRGGRDGTIPRLVVRIDDPWQAEDWRRRHVVDDPAVFSDTVGLYSVTSRELVQHALRRGVDRLLLLGSSSLTLALLDELAQHRREEAVFSTPPSLDVVVIDLEAHELIADHELHQSRYGNVGMSGAGAARVEVVEPDASAVRQLTEGAATPLVIDTREPSPARLREAERLAARLPGCPVLTWTVEARGIQSEPLMGNLLAFGLSLLASHEAPEDGWERIARRQHENFVHAYPDQSGHALARRPWGDLSDFYRQSNLRQIATTMKIATDAGRSWVQPTGSTTAVRPLSNAEIAALAHREHEAWHKYLTANGWRHGPTRDDVRRRHPNLVEWSSLDQEAKDKAARGVRDSFSLLASLGYHPFPVASDDTDGGAPMQRYRRTGRVHAVRQTRPWDWTTQSGDKMTGDTGDWLVTGELGDEWSIRDQDLRRSYKHVSGPVWERTGFVSARPGRPAEVVMSREGRTVVTDGDWVVEDDYRNRWVVPAARFDASYRRLTGEGEDIDSAPEATSPEHGADVS